MVSVTTQLKLLAPDGKRRLTDVLDYDGVVLLAKSFPNTRASRFVEWFTNSDETIDGKSKSKLHVFIPGNDYGWIVSPDLEYLKGIAEKLR